MLFAYWDGLRGERAAPERGEIEPGAIRHILADTFVLGTDGPDGATFRLAGTRCCALFGRELKGTAIGLLWPDSKRQEAERQVEIVVSETAGLVVGLRGLAANGWTIDLELLLLPLRHRGRTRARAIGAVSPVRVPSWVGLIPVVSLETTSLRIVNAARDQRASSMVRESATERRSRFVVHEGGLA